MWIGTCVRSMKSLTRRPLRGHSIYLAVVDHLRSVAVFTVKPPIGTISYGVTSYGI